MAETWVINEELTFEREIYDWTINFTSNNESFTSLYYNFSALFGNGSMGTQFYDGSDWINQAYRTITFAEPPTGDLLTWLQANAVQQVEPSPSTTNNIYFGTSAIDKVYFGSSEVSKIYYGTTLIYEAGGTPTPTLDPVLANNSWDAIKYASVNNVVPSSWAVGDTKSLTIGGVTYQARLVDTTGKYTRVSDNSTAYLKFELTASLPTRQMFNADYNNRPAQSPLLADMNSGTIYNTIDSSLLSAVEPVKVKVSQGGGSSSENTLIDYEAKFFLQREHDLFATRASSVQAEFNAIASQDEYYIANNTAAARIKQVSGSNSAYWEMSPYAGDSYDVCRVSKNGDAGRNNSNSTYGVALVFAL